MASLALTQAHIRAQAELRRTVSAIIAGIWARLGHYDQADVDPWLADALPVVAGAQSQSIALTSAFIAMSLKVPAFGVADPAKLAGAAVRGGTPPADVYTRPFITVWTALKNGQPWQDAVAQGQARAESAASMDVALSSRATFAEAQDTVTTDGGDNIIGYQRVADGGACDFCAEINGAFCYNADASPLHNHCGCGLEPIMSKFPSDATILPDHPSETDAYAIHDHGELGAVIGAPGDNFTTEADLAA